MLKRIKGELRPFCDVCQAALRKSNDDLRCPRCGHPRPNLTFTPKGNIRRERYGLVNLAANVVFSKDFMSKHHFLGLPELIGSKDNPDVNRIREFLEENQISFEKTISNGVVLFAIPENDMQAVGYYFGAKKHVMDIVVWGTGYYGVIIVDYKGKVSLKPQPALSLS